MLSQMFPDYTVIAVDTRNAFNTIDCNKIKKAVQQVIPDALPWVIFLS